MYSCSKPAIASNGGEAATETVELTGQQLLLTLQVPALLGDIICDATLTVVDNVGSSSSCSARVNIAPCDLRCTSESIKEALLALDGAAALQRQVLSQLAKLARSNGLKGLIPPSDLTTASNLYLDAWSIVWKLPEVVKSCQNQVLCVSISNAGAIADYKARSQSLGALVKSAAKRLLSRGGTLSRSAKRRIQSLRRSATTAQTAAQKVADQVPTTSSACLGDV